MYTSNTQKVETLQHNMFTTNDTQSTIVCTHRNAHGHKYIPICLQKQIGHVYTH